jgi:hypothetical protein
MLTFAGYANNDQHVSNLIDSFCTRFWLEKHQWYIHYHHSFINDWRYILLYTLPYALGDFDSNMLAVPYKSTCPEDINYYLYDRVTKINYKFQSLIVPSFIQFTNIRSLYINLPFDENFAKIVPILHHLN